MRESGFNGFGEARPIDRSFDAQNPLINLDLSTDMAAADHPAWCAADRRGDKGAGKRIESVEVAEGPAAPGAADLYAGINARPSEDRRRRNVRRRRGCTEGGRASRSRGSN